MSYYRYSDCPAMFGENKERRCVGCGKQLEGRSRVWCWGNCQDLWQVNHVWQMASPYAQQDPLRRRPGRLIQGRWRAVCARCGSRGNSRIWASPLETNHKEPILGRHAEVGCHHHQEGLEVLCHGCHVDETNRQFGRGKYRVADVVRTDQMSFV